MFNPTSKNIVYNLWSSGANTTFSKYNIPAFYDLWAQFDNNNNQFWRDAATAARNYLKAATNRSIGLGP